MRPEYDFRGGVRGKHYQAYRRGHTVTIHKTGSLEGNVTAKSIAIEKGGPFSGQLVIGQANLTQGELLPEAKATEKKMESDVPLGAAHPAHAT